MSRSIAGWLKAQLISKVELLALRSRYTYLSVASVVAMSGYGFLAFFPLVVITCMVSLFRRIPAATGVVDWIQITGISLVALVCLLTISRLFQFRFSRVQGLQLSRTQAPCLYDLIAEVREHYKRPAIKSVVITDRAELRIESIPQTGLPFLTSNHLVIGLPLLQILSVEEFRCELSRCVGQFSGLMPRITFFIYKADRLWSLYNRALGKSKHIGLFIPRILFRLYSPLLHIVVAPALRWEEMEADLCALDYINEREVFDALKSRVISDFFMERCYWPNVKKMVLKNPEGAVKPFENLEKIIRSTLNMQGRKKWMENACRQKQLPGDVIPIFRQRMEHMGHSKIKSIPVPAASALEELLGDGRKNVIAIIEKLWSSTMRSQWVREHKEKCRQLEKIKKLSQKSRQGVLWPAEILSYALLDRKVRGNPIKDSVLKITRRNIRNMLPEFLTNRVRSAERLNDIF
jgi:hypothetical protein